MTCWCIKNKICPFDIPIYGIFRKTEKNGRFSLCKFNAFSPRHSYHPTLNKNAKTVGYFISVYWRKCYLMSICNSPSMCCTFLICIPWSIYYTSSILVPRKLAACFSGWFRWSESFVSLDILAKPQSDAGLISHGLGMMFHQFWFVCRLCRNW